MAAHGKLGLCYSGSYTTKGSCDDATSNAIGKGSCDDATSNAIGPVRRHI